MEMIAEPPTTAAVETAGLADVVDIIAGLDAPRVADVLAVCDLLSLAYRDVAALPGKCGADSVRDRFGERCEVKPWAAIAGMPEVIDVDRAWREFHRRDAFRKRREADAAADGPAPAPVADYDPGDDSGDDQNEPEVLCGYVPSLQQIEAATAAYRATWNESECRKRAGLNPRSWRASRCREMKPGVRDAG